MRLHNFCYGLMMVCGLALAETTVKEPIPAQPVAEALSSLSRQTGLQIVYMSRVTDGVNSSAIPGGMSSQDALRSLLGETGLDFEFLNERTVTVFAVEEGKDRGRVSGAVMEGAGALRVAQGGAAGSAGSVASSAARSTQENSNAADAQEAPEEEEKLEEIVVTAQKREESLQEVPISIAVLSGADLDSRGISDLKDLSYSVPGLYVQQGSYERRVSIRGIGNVFGSSSTIGSYVDEAVAVGPSGANQLDLQTYDLARVEVLRGPQGTLYGQGSMGGTIRYITVDPDLTRVTGATDLSGSFTEDGDPSERLRGVVNLPLVQDKLGLRIAGVYENTGGWADQPALDKENINDREFFNVRTKALWRPVEALDITVMAIVHRDDRGASGNGIDENGNYQQSLLLPVTPSASLDYDLSNLTLSYEWPGVRLLSTSTYLDFDSEFRNRGHECCTPTPHVDGQWTAKSETLTAQSFSQEIRLISSGSGRLNWTVGGFYQDSKFIDDWGSASDNPFGTPGGAIFGFTIYSNERSESWAVFAETGFSMTDRFKVGAGLRYFEDDRKLQSALGGAFQSGTFNSTNPRVFADFELRDNVNLYASAAKGFRSGGFNAAGQPAFEPEELWSYELGTKMALLDRRMHFELAFTRSDYSDYQIIGKIPSVINNITSNAGEARVNVVDGSLAWKAMNDWEIGAAASYIDAKFTEINATNSSHLVGDPIDMVPEYGVALWTEHQFNWWGDGENPGFVRLDYSQQGKAHFRNRSFDTNYHSTSDVIGLLNARLGWARNRWTTELYAQNILDENGYDHPVSIERVATRAWPRNYGIRVGIDFN